LRLDIISGSPVRKRGHRRRDSRVQDSAGELSRYAECHDSLGLAYAKTGKMQLAMEEFQGAVVLKPDLAIAYYHLGLAQQRSGNPAAARAALTRAHELDPKIGADL
jgi:tetratricopeptide (TPR) repeat protein